MFHNNNDEFWSVFIGLIAILGMAWISKHWQFLLLFPFLLEFSNMPYCLRLKTDPWTEKLKDGWIWPLKSNQADNLKIAILLFYSLFVTLLSVLHFQKTRALIWKIMHIQRSSRNLLYRNIQSLSMLVSLKYCTNILNLLIRYMNQVHVVH